MVFYDVPESRRFAADMLFAVFQQRNDFIHARYTGT